MGFHRPLAARQGAGLDPGAGGGAEGGRYRLTAPAVEVRAGGPDRGHVRGDTVFDRTAAPHSDQMTVIERMRLRYER